MLTVLSGLIATVASSETVDHEGPPDGVHLSVSEIAAPNFTDPDWRTKILPYVRDLLEGRTETVLGISIGDGQHLVMVSLARQDATAVVARGQGAGLEPALRNAASRLRSHLTSTEIENGRLKVDGG